MYWRNYQFNWINYFEFKYFSNIRLDSNFRGSGSLNFGKIEEAKDSISLELLDNPLERNPLYKQLNEELKRKSLLNSDPTGQRKKAAGEDN